MTTRRRVARALTALAAATLVAATTLTGTAALGNQYDSGYSEPSLPGNSAGGGNTTPYAGGGGFNPTDYYCRDGALYRKGRGLWYHAPYFRCIPSQPRVEATNRYAVCISHMQVFRFYGTRRNPAAGWTTSMVNFPSWCPGSPQVAAWTTNALDRKGGTNAWQQLRNARVGGSADKGTVPSKEFVINKGLRVDPRFGSIWNLPGVPALRTTGRPFDGGGSCTRPQNSRNPFVKALNGKDVLPPEKTRVRKFLYRLYQDQLRAYPGKNNAYARQYARKATGIAHLSGSLNKPARIKITFDDLACSSPMKYVSEVDVTKTVPKSKRGKYRVTGACYIPVERYAQGFRRPDNKLVLQFPDLNKMGGMRYSDLYRSRKAPGTTADKRGVNNRRANRDEKAILNVWRNKMVGWYKKEVPNSQARSLRKGGHQVIPADPFAKRNSGTRAVDHARVRTQGFNRARAVKVLEHGSRCDFGTALSIVNAGITTLDTPVTPKAPKDPQTPNTPGGPGPDAGTREDRTVTTVEPRLGMVMRNHRVLQSGGLRHVQRVSVKDNGIDCPRTRAWCRQHNVRLTKLTYQIRVAAPAGMRLDAGSRSNPNPNQVRVLDVTGPASDCRVSGDRRSCTVNVSTTAGGSVVNLDLANFAPTEGNQMLAVTVGNVKATYEYDQQVRRSYTTYVTDPRTGRNDVRVTRYRWVTVKRGLVDKPTVTGAPAPLSGGGGTWTWRAPIIGATSIG